MTTTLELMRIYDEKYERWCFLRGVYIVKLEHMYHKGIITNDQLTEERNKLNDEPTEIEERIKYLEQLHETLLKVYFKSNNS